MVELEGNICCVTSKPEHKCHKQKLALNNSHSKVRHAV